MSSARSRPWLAPAAVVALAIGVYTNALPNPFLFDDLALVADNQVVQSFRHVPEILTGNLWGMVGRASNYYRPLPPLIHVLVHHFFGLAPWAFRLVNIGLHAGASLLVLTISSRLLAREPAAREPRPTWPATAAALLFAAHPVHVEAVAWIAGVMDVACAFFSLLALHLHLRAETRPGWPPRVLGLGAYFLALLSKEPAAALLAVLGAWTLMTTSGQARVPALLRLLPHLGVLGIYLALRGLALRGLAPVEAPVALGPGETVLTVLNLFRRYLESLLLPIDLNVLHHIPPVTGLSDPAAWVAMAVAAGYGFALWWTWRRDPGLGLGLVLLVAALLPALYLPGLTQKPENAMADRYLYLPSAGFALALAALLERVRGRGRRVVLAAATLVALVTVAWSAMTVARNRVWSSAESLWRDAAGKSPASSYAHENLGFALLRAGKAAEGRAELGRALELDPGRPDALVASAVEYTRAGLLKKAILELNAALTMAPASVAARYNLGVAYEARGWRAQAIAEYEVAVQLDPRHAAAWNNLGIAYAESGRMDRAVAAFRSGLEARPDDAELRHNLARALAAGSGVPAARP